MRFFVRKTAFFDCFPRSGENFDIKKAERSPGMRERSDQRPNPPVHGKASGKMWIHTTPQDTIHPMVEIN